MNNILQTLIYGSQPVEEAPAPLPKSFSRAMERRARANGFKTAEEMVLWARQRQSPHKGTISADSLPNIAAATDWHPSNIFKRVLGAMQGATGY